MAWSLRVTTHTVLWTRPVNGDRCPVLRTAVATTLLAVCLGGCDTPFEVRDPVPLDPLPSYLEWWVELEVCVGQVGSFSDIRWYQGESIVVGEREAYGVWQAPNVIVMKRFYTTSESAVKHEMIHHLTGGKMAHTHPDFTRCTGFEGPDSLSTWTVDPTSGAR